MSEKDKPFLALDSEKVYHEFDYETEEEDTFLLIHDFASQLKNSDLLKSFTVIYLDVCSNIQIHTIIESQDNQCSCIVQMHKQGRNQMHMGRDDISV